MQRATRAGLREVGREPPKRSWRSLAPRGGRRVFTRKTLIYSMKYAPATHFSQQNLANRSSETAQKPTLGVNCASKTTDFTLGPPSRWPLHASLQLSLSVMAGRTTSPATKGGLEALGPRKGLGLAVTRGHQRPVKRLTKNPPRPVPAHVDTHPFGRLSITRFALPSERGRAPGSQTRTVAETPTTFLM